MSQPYLRSSDHPSVPQLTSAGLQMFSYLPEALVEQTRAFFEATEAPLLPSQLEARDNFLFLFRLHQDQTYTDLGTLEELAQCLDEFFFAGLLMGGGDSGSDESRILRCLELEADMFAPAPPTVSSGSYGDVHTPMPLGASRLEPYAPGEWGLYISLDPNDEDGMPFPLHSLLESLLHQMVHGFLHSFVCYCGSCKAEMSRLALLGPTFHGRLFVELLGSITRVIREWDEDLAAFYLQQDLTGV